MSAGAPDSSLDPETAARVRETVGAVLVGDLRPHVARGVVLGCAPSLDLVAVGVALAQDDVAAVGAWLAAGALWRLDTEDGLTLADGEVWWAAVVRPWVLAQRRPAS